VVRIAAAPRPLAYVLSFWGIIDLLAILPSYLTVGTDMRAVRAMRLLRLFRLLKLVRYSSAADRIAAAIRSVVPELAVFMMATMVLVYVCALCIYYFEHDAQPKAFASVFHSMWWAAVTLTTVGYGDVYPITAGGQIFTVLVLFLALGIVAIPTGLIASALSTLRQRSGDGK
jgi:voltage-gated potassium channel